MKTYINYPAKDMPHFNEQDSRYCSCLVHFLDGIVEDKDYETVHKWVVKAHKTCSNCSGRGVSPIPIEEVYGKLPKVAGNTKTRLGKIELKSHKVTLL